MEPKRMLRSLVFLSTMVIGAIALPGAAGFSVGIASVALTSSVDASSSNTKAATALASSTATGADINAAAQEIYDELNNNDDDGIIPITVISGFLGSGKTTLLQHLLENKSGDCPVGVIVNDVADVNIDGKLVNAMESADGSSDGLVELENGCACCALSDELLSGVSELVTLSDLRRSGDGQNKDDDRPNAHLKPFKHIVVEMSGVSDPRNIRATFQEAEQAGMPLMSRTRLDTMVTVVDAEMFESYFKSDKAASRETSPELFREEDVFEWEDWMDDVPPELLKAILGHRGVQDEDANGVADLLVGQTETADVILLNKCDLLGGEGDGDGETNPKIQRLRDLVKALNPRSTTTILQSSYGKVALSSFLGVAKGNGVAMSGAVDDHREFVDAAVGTSTTAEHFSDLSDDAESDADSVVSAAASAVATALSGDGCGDNDCSECGDTVAVAAAPAAIVAPIEAAADTGCCDDPNCGASSTTAALKSHEHHDHDHAPPSAVEVEAEEDSHSHSHDHGHSEEAVASTSCTDPACSDPACSDHGSGVDHAHSHDHSPMAETAATATTTEFTDPTCTEDHSNSHSHSHTHSHSHSHEGEEKSTHAGIGTFVYRARRPFHPQRMLSFLRAMPIARGIPASEDEADEVETQRLLENTTDDAATTLGAVIRSKGFVWCADSHENSMYWSHAGASFEYKCLGRWWATLPRDQWPEGVDEYVLRDFDDVHHPSEGTGQGVAPESVGDRRQEVVFIGLGFGKASKQKDIRKTLDKCLLTDEEYKEYGSICFEHSGDPDELLQERFPTVMESEYINY